ncbi:MAG: helix-turn-helix transcriptional regulator [Acidobacteria bacterium]|nr:helix-turn-helix transcriptional regulator [Acidobacteriota bacterium]
MIPNTETITKDQEPNRQTADYDRDAALVAERLRRMRRRAGLTQATVAARLRRPTSFVGKYENGYRRLDVIELLKVAAAIGFDPAHFLTTIAEQDRNAA